MRPTLIRRLGTGVLVLIVLLVILFPVLWMALAGFKSKTEVLSSPFQFFPDSWNPVNYSAMLSDAIFMRSLMITLVGAALFTIGSLVINSLAAYAFARLEFRGKRLFWVYCITPMFVPMMAILLTSFMVVSKLHMLNTLAVLVIPGMASSLQMFFLRQFYLGYPAAMEEAALIDGANRWQIFLSIFLPQSKAPFVVVGTASFLLYFNAYVWPVLTITDPNLVQIMQVLGTFRSERGPEWGLLMAGSAIAAVPAVLLLLIFQRYIVSGVRLSGIK